MKYFQLEGRIDEALLTRFMDFCNNNQSENCTIVINSGGGKSTLASVVLDMINSNHKKITLVSAGCYSAALYIFYFAKCKRKIVYGSLGMHHKEYVRDISINSDNKAVYHSDVCEIKNMKEIEDNNFLNGKLTKKEVKLYNNGDDVYFTFKRMMEIFPDVEVIK